MNIRAQLEAANEVKWLRLLDQQPGKHRPFTRRALDAGQRRIQLLFTSRPCVFPKIKEKRLIEGKWTRDYE